MTPSQTSPMQPSCLEKGERHPPSTEAMRGWLNICIDTRLCSNDMIFTTCVNE